jgi:hypothetical protein
VPALADEPPADVRPGEDPVRVPEPAREHARLELDLLVQHRPQILSWTSRVRCPKTRTEVNLARTSGLKWAAASCSTKRRTEERETPSISTTPADPTLEVAMTWRSERSSVSPLASVMAASSMPSR